MKILLFTDLHMCPRASIVNKWGTLYPSRLENCIESVNWLERLAEEHKCDLVINLGDFFDRPELSSETITACKDLKWSNIMHYSIVGNHEASSSSLVFNAVNIFAGNNHKVITEPTKITMGSCELCFLPYIVECDRKPIIEYFGEPTTGVTRIIFSHNDIKGIQLGPIISKAGFELEEIENNCDLFLNGHLHNGQAISTKVINLGNFTGKDFGENAFLYSHNATILETDSLSITSIENPHAFNFYKLQVETEEDLPIFDKLKNNAVLSIKCDNGLLEPTKQRLALLDNILDARLIITKKYEEGHTDVEDIDLAVDHLAKFIECCKANIEDTNLLDEEISEICK